MDKLSAASPACRQSRHIAAFLIILALVVLSGIGCVMFQNTDHYYRNTLFEMLVKYSWPVEFDMPMPEGIIDHRLMIYYIGFWFPAAVVGKIFGLAAGYGFQILWAALGVFLFYRLVCLKLGTDSLWPLLVFFMFSGLDAAAFLLEGVKIVFPGHMEWWCAWQFSSFTTQLFWVFNQAIPAWVAVMLILLQKNNRYIVFILGSLLLCSTLPFIGLLPIAAYLCLSREYEGTARLSPKWAAAFLRDTFTLENVIGGGITGLLTFAYIRGNDSGRFHLLLFESAHMFFVYIVFLVLEVGVYLALLFPKHRKDGLFYVIGCCFVLCPIIQIGSSSDFCMRASIPSLVILYVMVCEALAEKKGVGGSESLIPWLLRSVRDGKSRGAGTNDNVCGSLKDIVDESANEGVNEKVCGSPGENKSVRRSRKAGIICLADTLYRKYLRFALIVVLLVGMVTPVHEIGRSIVETTGQYAEYGTLHLQKVPEYNVMTEPNFSGSTEDNFYYRYLAG